MNMQQKPMVIGVGNEFREDDAAGILVARRLRDSLPLWSVQVEEAPGEGTRLMDLWKGRPLVMLVDAVQSGSEPGTIHRLQVPDQVVPAAFFRYSSHLFGVAEAIELARLSDELPADMVIYGIEGKAFGYGTEPTAPVAAAMEQVIVEILQRVSRFGETAAFGSMK